MKKHVITAFFALLATVAVAESNFGKDNFGIGEYSKAKDYFEGQLVSAPAESNYYLGEIAWTEGNADLALSYFEKGISADLLYPMNYVGKGKTLLKSNQKEAEAIFSTILKKNKKNAEVNVGIARAYYETGLRTIVPIKLEVARKVAKKSPLLYIFEGDMLVAEQKISESVSKFGEAAGKYETALYYDPSNTVAALKFAEVYALISEDASIEKVNAVIAAHPDYTVAYRTLGRVYNSVGKYKSAIDAYVKYYGEGKCDPVDIDRLAAAYFWTGQYSKSIVLIDEVLAKDSMDFIMNRLKMYNAAKIKDSTGITIANRFFSTQGRSFVDMDYASYATILAEGGRYTEALEQYNKVLTTSAAKPETYKELATLYTQMKFYAKSAETAQKYIDMVGGIDVAEGSDYYNMGRSWYNAGQALRFDSTELGLATAKEYFIKADTTFGVVSVKSPDSHISYLWRGHTNAALDPNTSQGLAKPYYEKALALILKKVENGANIASYRRDLINIYRYEAWYYFDIIKDKDRTIVYCNKILELDPTNADAMSLIDSYNPPAPKLVTKGVKTKKTAVPAATVPATTVIAPATQSGAGPKVK